MISSIKPKQLYHFNSIEIVIMVSGIYTIYIYIRTIGTQIKTLKLINASIINYEHRS